MLRLFWLPGLAALGLSAAPVADPPGPAPSGEISGSPQDPGTGPSATIAGELPPPAEALRIDPGVRPGLLAGLTEMGELSGVRVLVSKQARPRIVAIGNGLESPLELEPGEAWAGVLGPLEAAGVGFELLRPDHGPLLWIYSGDSAPAPPPLAEPSEQLLPAPKGSLVLDPQESGMLFAAFHALARSSGVRLLVTHEARAVLENPTWNLSAAMTLPPEAAWSFLESILFQLDLALVLHSGAATPLASIQTLPENGDTVYRTQALRVGPESLAEMEAHPALYFHLTLPVEALNPRHTVNSLRGMASSKGAGVLPVGYEGFKQLYLPHPDDRAVWIGGRGRTVHAIARAILLADESKLAETR